MSDNVVTVEITLNGHTFKAAGDAVEVSTRQASFQATVERMHAETLRHDALVQAERDAHKGQEGGGVK